MMTSLRKSSCVVLTVVLAILLVNGCLTVGARAGDAKPTPGMAPKPGMVNGMPLKMTQADMMAGLDWSATKQSFLDEKGAVVLTGSAWIRYTGLKLEAENIVFYRETRELYGEGHCRLRLGETEMEASAVYLDVDSDTGYMIDAVMKITADASTFGSESSSQLYGIKQNPALHQPPKPGLHPAAGDGTGLNHRDPYGIYLDPQSDPQARTSFMLKAEKFIRRGKLHFEGENAFLTNDEMAHPIYGLKAEVLDFYLHEIPDMKNPGQTTLAGEKVIAQHARVQVFGYDTFALPTVTYDMANRREYFGLIQGNSGRWGNYYLSRFGYDMGPAKGEMQTKPFQFTHVYVDADERWKRGPGFGAELAWQTEGYQVPGAGPEKLYYEYGSGYVHGYGEYEFQIDEADDLVRARRDLERRIQPKIDGFPRISFDANLLFLARRKADNAGPPNFQLQLYQNNVRGLADVHEHLPIRHMFGVNDVQLDLVYDRQSDRDFALEYFPANYNRQSQSQALGSLRKAGDDYSLEFLYRTRPEDFDSSPPRSPFDYGTFTGYEPSLTYSTMPKDIGLGIYMSSEEQLAHMTRYFEKAIYNQPNFDSDRLSGKVDLSRPTKLWCLLNVTPHLGGQGMLYDNSRQDNDGNLIGANGINGHSLSQAAVTYGLDLDTRFYGLYGDVKNEALGVNGLRHIIEPKISFQGVSNTATNPVKVLDFDEIDDLNRNNVITFSIENTFQTRIPVKEGDDRAINFAGFNTALDVIPSETDRNRLYNGNAFGLWTFDGFIRVLDVVKFSGGLGINPQSFTDETAQYKILIDPHDRWRMQFTERFNYTDPSRAITGSDQYHLQFDYELSDHWAISYEEIIEKKKSLGLIKGQQLENIGLTRHFGPVDAGVVYSKDLNLDDNGYYFFVRPTYVTRNLILPENDPLVNPAEVSGDFEEPESRNFDPFQILRQQSLQRKAKRQQSQGGGPDVPGPPEPTSMGNAPDRNKPSAETVDLDKLPGAKPAKKKAPVDADDWTLPASVPTSNGEK